MSDAPMLGLKDAFAERPLVPSGGELAGHTAFGFHEHVLTAVYILAMCDLEHGCFSFCRIHILDNAVAIFAYQLLASNGGVFL